MVCEVNRVLQGVVVPGAYRRLHPVSYWTGRVVRLFFQETKSTFLAHLRKILMIGADV